MSRHSKSRCSIEAAPTHSHRHRKLPESAEQLPTRSPLPMLARSPFPASETGLATESAEIGSVRRVPSPRDIAPMGGCIMAPPWVGHERNETQPAQVDGSAAGRDDVGPDLAASFRYSLLLRIELCPARASSPVPRCRKTHVFSLSFCFLLICCSSSYQNLSSAICAARQPSRANRNRVEKLSSRHRAPIRLRA